MAFYHYENPTNYFSENEYIFEDHSTVLNNNIYGDMREEESWGPYPGYEEEIWEQGGEWVGEALRSGEGPAQWWEGDEEPREEREIQEWRGEEGAEEWGYEPDQGQWFRAQWDGDEQQDLPWREPSPAYENPYPSLSLTEPPPQLHHQNPREWTAFALECPTFTSNQMWNWGLGSNQTSQYLKSPRSTHLQTRPQQTTSTWRDPVAQIDFCEAAEAMRQVIAFA